MSSDIKPLEEQPLPQVMTLERGKYYDLAGPNGEKTVVMLKDTWADYGTHHESLRQIASNQDKRLKELQVENKILIAKNLDISTRLENLRQVRRDEKRPEVESMFDQPTSPQKGN